MRFCEVSCLAKPCVCVFDPKHFAPRTFVLLEHIAPRKYIQSSEKVIMKHFLTLRDISLVNILYQICKHICLHCIFTCCVYLKRSFKKTEKNKD